MVAKGGWNRISYKEKKLEMGTILYIMELRRSVFFGPFRILRGVPYS